MLDKALGRGAKAGEAWWGAAFRVFSCLSRAAVPSLMSQSWASSSTCISGLLCAPPVMAVFDSWHCPGPALGEECCQAGNGSQGTGFFKQGMGKAHPEAGQQ